MGEIGYCVKCKAKKEMKDTQKVTNETRRVSRTICCLVRCSILII